MKTILTFTGNKVQVICGDSSGDKISVSKIITADFSANCVMNGTITDQDVFVEGIRRLWTENKLPKVGVVLSVDGNHIRTKRVTVPKLSPKKTKEIISYEFRDTNMAPQDSVYSFMALESGSKELTAIGISAEKTYVTGLNEAFGKAGIKLACITASRCGIIKTLGYLDEIKGKNCVIQSIDGDILSTILVEQGRYVSFSSTRVFSDHGSVSFGSEVARSVSQLLQYQSSVRSTNTVTDVFYIGFSEGDFAVSRQQTDALGLGSVQLKSSAAVNITEGTLADCFNHAGVLVLGRAEANLYHETVSNDDKIKKRDQLLLKILPIIALVAVLSIISSIMVTSNISREKKVTELNNFLTDEKNIQAKADYENYLNLSAVLNAKISAAADIKAAIESYPKAVSALNDTIASCGVGIVEVTINSYDSATGSLNFTSTGSNADKLNGFIEALTDTGIFNNVTYSGYSLKEGGNTYDVNVSCVLSESAGK